MNRIYWDTMLFVYLLEEHPEFADQVDRIHRRMLARGDQICTSTFTRGELLVAPLRTGNTALANLIRVLLGSSAVDLIPFESSASESYATIRATTSVRPADAIHLACAATAKTSLFLTNDKSLHGLVVPGIQFIGGLDVNVL
jgi:predicted nucleic acid-binding protein